MVHYNPPRASGQGPGTQQLMGQGTNPPHEPTSG